MEDSDHRSVLRAGVFAGLSDEDARVLGSIMQPEHFSAGDAIAHQGQAEEDLFLLASGEAEVRRTTASGDVSVLKVLLPGDHFGEIGLLHGGIRTADVIAVTAGTVLRLSRSSYDRHIRAALPSVHDELVSAADARGKRTGEPAEAQTDDTPFDRILRRLIRVEIDAMRAAEIRGEAPSFQEIVEFYGATRFLYPGKLGTLEPRWSEVRRTWERLIAANNDVFKVLLLRQVDGDRIVPKNSISAFEWTPGTWQAQHLVSVDRHEYSGTLASLIGLIDWLDRRAKANFIRLTYRTDNPGAGPLFDGVVGHLPTDSRSVTQTNYWTADVSAFALAEPDPDIAIIPVRPADAAGLRRFYGQVLQPVEIASLRLDDLALGSLGPRYERHGLARERSVFAARWNDRIVGAVICNRSSEGMNFSFLENTIEHVRIDSRVQGERRAAILRGLLDVAATFYRSTGAQTIVAMTQPEDESILQELVMARSAPKRYSTLTVARALNAFGAAQAFFTYHYKLRLASLAAEREAS